MREKLVGKRVDKIYQYRNYFVIKIGSDFVNVKLPDILTLSTNKIKEEFKMTNFCIYLRKKLSGKKVENIELVNNDRIVRIVFDEFVVYLEFFSKGNLIICDKTETILMAGRYEERKGRSIKRKKTYAPPTNINPINYSDYEMVYKELKNSDNVEKILKKMGVPFEYVDLSKNKKEISEKIVYMWTNGLEGIEKIIENLNEQFLKDISETLQKRTDKGKCEKIINSQNEKIKEMENEIEKINGVIEYIYSNYNLIEKMLVELKTKPDKVEYYSKELNLDIMIEYPKIKIKKLD